MSFAPQRDWAYYRSVVTPHDLPPKRTPEVRLQIYADFFNTVAEAQASQTRPNKFDQQRWKKKLAIKRKMAAAFQAMDSFNRERIAANRPD